MSAPRGNQYWKRRSSHGRNPIFDKPEDFLSACIEYFEHADANPIITYKPYVGKDGEVNQLEQIHPRPYTIEGLLVFIGISRACFDNYKARNDFVEVCEEVLQTIRDQKLSGAIAGIYNHAIVARDLKLRDTVDANLGGQEGNPIVSRVERTIVDPSDSNS